MDFRLVVPRSMSLGLCPKCNVVGSLDRVRINNVYDKILLYVFKIRSYHCRECKLVVKFSLYKLRNNPGKIIGNYIILILSLLIVILVANIILKK